MKTIYILALSLLLSLILSACVPYTPIPIGIWKSEMPEMMLFVTNDYAFQGRNMVAYPWLYRENSKEQRGVLIIGNASQFTVESTTSLREDGLIGMTLDTIAAGSFRLVSSNELRFTLTPAAQQRTDYTSITFHRVEEYEPINIRDWGAHLDDIEVWFPSPEYEEEE
jgi:hypothetical protein